nr:MAG TPA_asm: hypothetical protein [Caudoviricetes sp.]
MGFAYGFDSLQRKECTLYVWFKSTPHQLQQTRLATEKHFRCACLLFLPIKRSVYYRHT